MAEPPNKRPRLAVSVGRSGASSPVTLTAPVSPPGPSGMKTASASASKLKSPNTADLENYETEENPGVSQDDPILLSSLESGASATVRIVPSPFQLTKIKDLPAALNVDTVSLGDILGHPLIKECWEFNYLHDVDFLMGAFDEDIRTTVDVHVVHGFWKKEEAADLQGQASKYPNVTLHTAYMPEMFGTHHTKMIVLFRHDDVAQIIIHTANLIQRDWRNMTQAVWSSPLLPLKAKDWVPTLNPALGSGEKFRADFLNYLEAYNTKRIVCRTLIAQLEKHDLGAIRGTLIGSVPGTHCIEAEKQWGWPALRKALSDVPTRDVPGNVPEVVMQVSSMATFTDKWLINTLLKTLDTSSSPPKTVDHKVVFPTANDIRRSLDGYSSGHSIHTKVPNGKNNKQLLCMKPLFYHWAGDGGNYDASPAAHEAGRKRAAPHIKTYIRFASPNSIDWALLTSANLSKQAWGEACSSAGDVRISSYELGVLVWPALFAAKGEGVSMVPVFKKDLSDVEGTTKVVGLRMPYDLPLRKYKITDEPWCASSPDEERDWKGVKWPGYKGK